MSLSEGSLARPTIQSARRRPMGKPLPFEGENGLFSESWFPICLSEEVKPGSHIGRDFLDGRVVIMRKSDGSAQVLSAYCPHLGADLSVGDVVDDTLRCAFHHWRYDVNGKCIATEVGDPPPTAACLYKFPTQEKYGLIWAFNGDTPWWDIPSFPYPEEELSIKARYYLPSFPTDPWVVCCNTPDWQHIRSVHRIALDPDRLQKQIEWTDHSMNIRLQGVSEHGSGPAVDYHAAIHGTSIFHQYGTRGDLWFATMTPFGMPRPGTTQVYVATALKKTRDGTGEPIPQEELDQTHLFLFNFVKEFVSDDDPILLTARYRPGTLTASDRVLSRYFDLLRNFPRSHPSNEFIK